MNRRGIRLGFISGELVWLPSTVPSSLSQSHFRPETDFSRFARQPPPISKHWATFDLSAKYEPIFIQLTRQLAACPPNTWPLPSFPCAFSLSFRNGWPGKPRFDSAVASCGYYRQRATGHHRPAAREQSHLLRLRQRALHLLSACISGSQALMKGGRNDHI